MAEPTVQNQSEWYTNKEIYQMMLDLKADLQETRIAVKQYNGLRQKIFDIETHIANCKSYRSGKYAVGQAIRDWAGWIIAIVMAGINIVNYLA